MIGLHKICFWSHSCIVLLTLLLAMEICGQGGETSSAGSWLVVSGQNHISEKLCLPTIGILKTNRFMNKTAFGFFSTGITYIPNTKMAYAIGAAHLDTQPFHHTACENLTTQWWLYQEIGLGTKLGPCSWHHRWRWEQRWINKMGNTTFNMRVRYRFQLSYPVSTNMYLKLFNEPFFNLFKEKIDQNRFYLGLGKRINSQLALEVGYFKNHIGKSNYDLVRMAVIFNTKLYRKTVKPKNTTVKLKDYQ